MSTVSTAAQNASVARSAGAARPSGPSRVGRLRRGIGMVAVIAAGAGVIGLGTSVGTASAEPAPAHAGWDGSRYWFKNSQGQWRWTTHYDVYLARTGRSATATTTVRVSNGGIKQGWDGTRYWFKNSKGEWRWTSHYDIYLARTGGGAASASSSSAGASADSAPAVAADGDVETAVQFALAQLGKPFKTAGNGPDGYDCSGLVQQSFRRGGISLPRVANDQYAATTPVRAAQLQRGDLLFWSDDGSARGIHHVAIYLGNNQYVEAARPGTNIRISRISTGYYPTHMGRP